MLIECDFLFASFCCKLIHMAGSIPIRAVWDSLGRAWVVTRPCGAVRSNPATLFRSLRRYVFEAAACAKHLTTSARVCVPVKQFPSHMDLVAFQFSSIQEGICAFGKARMRSIPSLRSSSTLLLKQFQSS